MILVNVDGYISELPEGTAYIEFRSGQSLTEVTHVAGVAVYRDEAGERLESRSLAAEFNLPQAPWWERVER